MESKRGPFQGVLNIIRFNWHFYLIAGIGIVGLFVVMNWLPDSFQIWGWLGIFLVIFPLSVSLLVSWYVYDLSGLYHLKWLNEEVLPSDALLVNIHAGFDETSSLLKTKFPEANLRVLDFYDPALHTEVSIRRARKAYPPYPGTESISTQKLPFASNSVDRVCLIFAAHEIRDEAERIAFFRELKRILKPDGKVWLTEHLRDIPNFLAYNIGFLHFHERSTWEKTFSAAG
ncbi:MAG: methyltransferase domain-containing protein, partial [Bacteroidota bacterium]